ncbi:MAG: YkgJ family cysteine cluster protein [Thermodesulfobacteriota bacterium]
MEELLAPTGDTRTWLSAYLGKRARLAALHSEFHCDPACTRPGCMNPEMLVPVSILDLLGLAERLEEPVSVVYRRYYSLGLFPNERTDWLRVVGMKLQKPCAFLENDLCGIYPVRPLPCILFPEYLAAEGQFAAQARKEHFRDYFCFQGPLLLSPERAGIMIRLKQMWTRETLLSSFHLFGHAPCYLDFSNLVPELRQQAGERRSQETAASPEPDVIPHSVLEGFFKEHLARLQPFAGVEAKIEALDNQEGQEHFLRLFQDDRLLKKLIHGQDERALIFQFVRGKLRAKRRSLLPREYQFY